MMDPCNISRDWLPHERLALIERLSARAQTSASAQEKTHLAETIHLISHWPAVRLEPIRHLIIEEVSNAAH